MKISNEQLSKLYEEENGKLLLGLSNTRFNQYVEIINNTKAYIEIIDSAKFKQFRKGILYI